MGIAKDFWIAADAVRVKLNGLMVSLRHRNFFFRTLWHLGHSPGRLIDVVQCLALIWVLIQTLMGFGGFLAYGEPMIGVSKSLILLAAIHALSIAFREDRPGIGWPLLLPLPLLVYGWCHFQFLSDYGMESGSFLAVMVQAYALYFITFNSIHGVRTGKWLLNSLQLSVVIALLAAFFQFYLFPDWTIDLDRMRNPAYAYGAAGFLQDPISLAGILIALFPLSFLLAIKYFRSGPMWVWQTALGIVFFIGFFLSSSLPGLMAGGLVLVLLPLFAKPDWRSRLKIWRNLFIGIGLLLPLFWFGTEDLHERLAGYFSGTGDALGGLSREVALSQFADKPLLGQGLGSFAHNWEGFANGFSTTSSLYPISAYADLLAETGILGLILFALPLLVLIGSAYRSWAAIPHMRINSEVLGRIENLPQGHPMRRRLEKEKGRVPSQKAVLGGLLVGGGAWLVYLGWDYSLKLPYALFTGACLAGILAAFARTHHQNREKRYRWVLVAILPLLLAVWAASFGAPRFYASHLTFAADEQLSALLDDPDTVFQDPGAAHLAEKTFLAAAKLSPANPTALLGAGNSQLALIDAHLESSAAIAKRAVPVLEEAQRLAPGSWLANYSLARALILAGGSDERAISHLRMASALAPYRPEPAGLLGSILLLRDTGSAEGLALVEKSLSHAPDYEPAFNSLQRHQIRSGLSDSGIEVNGASMVTASILAEQFRVIAPSVNRITGAGLPALEKELASPLEF